MTFGYVLLYSLDICQKYLPKVFTQNILKSVAQKMIFHNSATLNAYYITLLLVSKNVPKLGIAFFKINKKDSESFIISYLKKCRRFFLNWKFTEIINTKGHALSIIAGTYTLYSLEWNVSLVLIKEGDLLFWLFMYIFQKIYLWHVWDNTIINFQMFILIID